MSGQNVLHPFTAAAVTRSTLDAALVEGGNVLERRGALQPKKSWEKFDEFLCCCNECLRCYAEAMGSF